VTNVVSNGFLRYSLGQDPTVDTIQTDATVGALFGAASPLIRGGGSLAVRSVAKSGPGSALLLRASIGGTQATRFLAPIEANGSLLAGRGANLFNLGVSGPQYTLAAPTLMAPVRLAQDRAISSIAPSVLSLTRPIGLSATQNAAMQADIASLQAAGATEFRVNQQQVNAAGNRVGINRPDLQYSDANGNRVYIEYDTPSSTRGPGHKTRILANDPAGTVILKEVP
jgi:hypothetical protein